MNPLTPLLPGQNPLADSLFGHLPKIDSILKKSNYSEHVIEKAIGRLLHAATPYVSGEKGLGHIKDWQKWLYGSALKAARQEAYREPKVVFVDPRLYPASTTKKQSTVETFSDEQNETIMAAKKKLTERQRMAVELCLEEGQSIAAAARKMGCTPPTVRAHLERGKFLLTQMLSTGTRVHSPGHASVRGREI
jgi:DNA-directed RNA polymerase specialized sigma24 family protein